MERNNELRLAVLIDAENVPSGNIKEMMEEIAKYGTPTFKRIYADWTKPQVNRWKTVLLEHAITPIQQFSYTQGKNASDSAMIIDAMDILYTGRVDGFCIISSDSDFTRLALRLREAGMKIIGMGEKKTPNPFIVACDKFIYIEILGGKKARPETEVRKPAVVGQVAEPEMDAALLIRKVDAELIALLSSTVSDMADEAGWAFLGEVGNLVLKKKPDFDSRNYGYRKLAQLVKSADAFEMDERLTEKGNIKHVYIRVKPIKEPIKDVTKATTKEPSKKGIKKSVKNVVSPTLETGGETAIAPAIAAPKKSAGKPSVKSTPAKDEPAPEKGKVAAIKNKEKAVKKSKK